MTENSHSSNYLGRGTVICLAAVILADLFFYCQPVGWTLGLYAVLLFGMLLWLDEGARIIKTFHGAVIILGTAGLILSLVYQPGAIGIIMTAVGLITLGLTSRCGWTRDVYDWCDRWFRFVFVGWRQIFIDARSAISHRSEVRRRWGMVVRSLWKSGPVIILAFIFIGLFAVANPVIANWLETCRSKLQKVFNILEFLHFNRVLMWFIVAVLSWALMRYQPIGRTLKAPKLNDTVLQVEKSFLNTQKIVWGLVVFNAIFAIQNALDIGYLWGGAELPQGMTYAEYAQRGAYPLVATALLAAGFVLVTFRAGSEAGRSRIARNLVYLWIAQNVFLTASAGWRLNLYVEVFSLTRLRVAAGIWMLLVAFGLIWICLRIITKRSNAWLVNVNVLTLVIVLYGCVFVNFSGFIAWYNCRHCYEVTSRGANLDLNYVRKLGPEAIPALKWLKSEVKNDVGFTERVKNELHVLTAELTDDLRNWRGWTWRRYKLMKSVAP
ncbi:MAG: DUF4173 domain-containing protein [Verrucomicrobia bacterium]|nr:DUF4173 domain-containing protein [Verrucomicrobiota bacterium]MCF7707771.1 DUF4173 domain-containing protein [Verrucomicrobiota bacterium]